LQSIPRDKDFTDVCCIFESGGGANREALGEID
jgi:hypothetical protein